MSNYMQPPTHDYYAQPQTPRRPVSVTVLSIIVIVLSALGLFSPCAAIPLLVELPQMDPSIQAMRNDPVVFAYALTSAGFAFVMAIIGLIGSVGSLRLRAWARSLLIFYAIVSLITTIANWVLNLTLLAGRMPAPADQTQEIIQFITQIFGLVVGFVLPVLILFFFTRPNVKEAFARV